MKFTDKAAIILRTAVEAAVERHGSYRNAAKIIGVDNGYLACLGVNKFNPSEHILKKLGLRKVVSFEEIK